MSRPDTEGFYISMGVKNIYKLVIIGVHMNEKTFHQKNSCLDKCFDKISSQREEVITQRRKIKPFM